MMMTIDEEVMGLLRRLVGVLEREWRYWK